MASELPPGVPPAPQRRLVVVENSGRPKDDRPNGPFIEPTVNRVKHEAEFAKAFAAAQLDFGPIERTQVATVRPRDPNKQAYSFKYAPLDVVLAAVRPALNKHGFALTQRISEDKQWVVSSLISEHGTRENWYPIFFQDLTSQSYAGSVTYARRYGACLLLGVAAEDDDDGNRGDGNQYDQRPVQEQRQAAKGKTNKPMRQQFPAPAKSGPTALAAQPAESSPASDPPDPFTLQAPHAPWAQNPYEPPEDPTEASRVEGIIADAIQDLHEAALEGRRITIEQVWEELGDNHYAKQEIWTRMKSKHADSFATIKGVLHPEAAAPRRAGQREKSKK